MRTSYVDIDIEAEDVASAERLAEAALLGNAGLFDQCQPIGRSLHRVIAVAVSAKASEDVRIDAA